MAGQLDALTAPHPARRRPARVPAPDHAALLRDRIGAMFAYNPTSLAGHAVGALVVELVFAAAAPPRLRAAWGGAFALLWLWRVLLAWRLARDAPAPLPALLARRRAWAAGTLATAALWGWAAWSFYPYGGALQQVALVLVVYTFCVACVPILAPQFGLYLGFVALVWLPAVARVALQDGGAGAQTAAVMAVAMAMTLLLGRNHRSAFDRVSRLQRRTEALTEQLRAEKAVADAARRDAEVANRAKTQFFSAASHDLRQPLHAMGLFAEALRLRVHEPAVAQLVNSINESVDALEGLFSELLDVTRIDSGAIEVHPRSVDIDALLRKLRLHFEPTAFEKGLALRLRASGRIVFADAVLVERIVRNLVSNAVRYTRDGGVLVACRRRGGRALLQVWDTGVGIAEAEQARIFDEFYQVDGDAGAGAGQRRGLGLGLAIVRRLADLIGAPLTLRSRPGRGSVFTLELPLADAAPADPARADAAVAAALSLAQRRIVVVEDDAAVREGLEVLLRGWGAQVHAFADVAACRDWAGRASADAAPALLIVDHRLGDGASGVDAIAALRRRFGAAIPAIVVTGSTLAGHADEAQANDFHVLVKPVLPYRLRAVIAFKLQLRRG